MTAVPSDALRRKLDTLPDGPGVYLWKDADGRVLYVATGWADAATTSTVIAAIRAE